MEINLYVAMGLVFLVGSLLLISEVVFSYTHYARVEPRMSYEEDVRYSRILKEMLFRRILIIGIAVSVSEALLVTMQLANVLYK